jgi:hypothetical protein
MRRVPPGHHVFVARNPGASAGDESSLGSLDALPPANLHGYAEWDFSSVPDPVMFRRFLDVTDYWFGYYDDSSTRSYDPARECCVVISNDPANATGAAGAGDGEVTPAPGIAPRLAAGPSTPAGADIDAQLVQARELEAKLAEEYRTVRLLRASMAGEASARGERARKLGLQARDRINADFNVDNPDTPPRASQKLIASATLLRAMTAPSTPEARNLHREAQALIEQAAVQHAESSASRIRQQGDARADGAAQGGEPSVHAGEAAERPANPGRTPAKERLLDTRKARDGDARNVINARRTSKADTRAEAGYHPRRGGRYDSDEDRSPTPEPPGTRVFSREIRAAAFPQRFRQPTTIVKYNGETDPRVWLNDYRLACQLGGATSDKVIICNLPLHLGDSARMWIEHLPASKIHNWDDLVRTFVGNSQAWHNPKLCTPSSRAPRAGISYGSWGAARLRTQTSCSTSPPASPQEKRPWGQSSTARRTSARTMRPRRAASSGSPTGRTSGARKGRSRAARRASRGATAMTPRPLLLTRLDEALDRPLEVRGCSTTC